jgi:hypothetical protein
MKTSEETEVRSIISLLVEHDRTVQVPREDFVENARGLSGKEFSRAFENKVSGHTGFSASIRSFSSDDLTTGKTV